mgnify:CR=1 FL=1
MLRSAPRIALVAAASAMIIAPTLATGRSADSLRDLVGARGSSGESALESRGWVLTDGHQGSSSAYTYWWNASRKDCVMVTTRNGEYASISDATPGDCNQRNSGGGNAAAAVGAVAAIAAIAALASHKSGHHDSGQHYSDQGQEAAYERGYNDGLYNEPYHNYDRSDSYSSGYQNGVEQRRNKTSYRDTNRWGAGYSQSVNLDDLEGARAAGAESDMQSRGFRSVDGFQSGNGRGTVWWNGRTRQCMQMIVTDGRVDSVTDIHTHPNCR